MSVDEVYKLMQFIINKSQNGYLTPDEFNLVINQAQTSYMDYLIGQFQDYQAGRPIPKVQFGNNEITRQRVTPFIYSESLIIDTYGFSAYPYGYLQTDTMWKSNGVDIVRFAQQDYLASFVNSRIDPIASNPIYLVERTGFRFYPNNLGEAKVSYIKEPNRIVWDYTLNVDGLPVYNPATSSNPQWSDLDILEIISRALRMVGVNLQSSAVSQYANEITKTGQ